MDKQITSPLYLRILSHPIARILLGIMGILGAILLVKTLLTRPLIELLVTSREIQVVLGALGSTVTMLLAFWLWIRYVERRKNSDFGLKGALGETCAGLLLGFASLSVTIALLYFLGYFKVVGMNDWFAFFPVVAYLIGGAVFEELIFRGLMLRILAGWKGVPAALITSSLVFQLPHFFNPNEAPLSAVLGVLFGLLCGALYLYSGRLWLPISFHLGWNLAQPFFGTTLSGIDDFANLLNSELTGPELLTGSAFGVEDSLISLATILIALSGLWYVMRNGKGGYRSWS